VALTNDLEAFSFWVRNGRGVEDFSTSFEVLVRKKAQQETADLGFLPKLILRESVELSRGELPCSLTDSDF